MAENRRTVLVTGAAGYIGSHTCKALANAGYQPVAYDSLVRGNRWAVKWGPFEEGELSDSDRLAAVFGKHSPIGVIHFAAFAYVGESMDDPLLYYSNNVAGTLSLLKVMDECKVRRMVFSSTCATYGIPETNPISEQAEQFPINPYGQSKLMVEKILRDWCAAGPNSAIALRYFNACGADLDGEIGEEHDPETHLIPLALAAARGNAPSLTVFGRDHDTPDGTCIRDYVHVSDLSDAHVRALERSNLSPGFEAFNLGTGRGISILEIIKTVRETTGFDVPFEYGPRRPGDPSALVADPKCANEVLGWHPTRSDLPSIVQSAWNWMEKSK